MGFVCCVCRTGRCLTLVCTSVGLLSVPVRLWAARACWRSVCPSAAPAPGTRSINSAGQTSSARSVVFGFLLPWALCLLIICGWCELPKMGKTVRFPSNKSGFKGVGILSWLSCPGSSYCFFFVFFFKEFGNLADGLDLWKRLAACKQTLLFSVGGHTCFAGVSGVLRGLRTAFVLCDTQLEGCCYLRLCCVPLML